MPITLKKSWIQIRIRIEIETWIRIRIKVNSWARIRIKVMRICNPALEVFYFRMMQRKQSPPMRRHSKGLQ
jgi:hypothetical protein